jgi:hypothetical protein
LKLATKNKRKLGVKQRARGKTSSTFVKGIYVREELGRRKVKCAAVMNCKKGEHTELGQHNREQ